MMRTYNGAPFNGAPFNGAPFNGAPFNQCASLKTHLIRVHIIKWRTIKRRHAEVQRALHELLAPRPRLAGRARGAGGLQGGEECFG